MRPCLRPPPAISVSPEVPSCLLLCPSGKFCALLFTQCSFPSFPFQPPGILLSSYSIDETGGQTAFSHCYRTFALPFFFTLKTDQNLGRLVHIAFVLMCGRAATGWSLRLLSITRLECYSFFEVKLLLLQFDARELDRVVVGTGG